MILIPPLAISTQSGSSPVFQLCKTMVGGKWEGVAGKNTRIEFTFHFEDDGNKFVAVGQIGAGSAHPISVHSSYGWDAEKKQVYYLDQHGYDTVYFGHVTREGNDLVLDFKGLAGDAGHYASRAVVSKDSYVVEMSTEKDGKWESMGLHIQLHRITEGKS
jgi:hypothetical protein